MGGLRRLCGRHLPGRVYQVLEDIKPRDVLEASPDEVIRFECEECGEPVEFPMGRRGKVETCPHCHKYLDVPE